MKRANRGEEGIERDWERRHLETRGPKPRTLHPNSQNLQPPPLTVGCPVLYHYLPHPPLWENVTDRATDPLTCSAPAFEPLPPVRGGVGGNLAGNGSAVHDRSVPQLAGRKKRGRKERLNSSEVTQPFRLGVRFAQRLGFAQA
ncbi:hypothetical protein PFLUV_G00011140 [Perca fluviatilis]|uniref:Uncharacterized protein n=1 Tax=Perca fluviatilis TaxID=8168 RepID=A0A6A5FRV4_PERFL|nr:hypothetical protein PFLUV_G00011140 [Perca fluviatilis]